ALCHSSPNIVGRRDRARKNNDLRALPNSSRHDTILACGLPYVGRESNERGFTASNHFDSDAGRKPEHTTKYRPEAGRRRSQCRGGNAHRRTSLVSRYVVSHKTSKYARSTKKKGSQADCPGDAAVLNGEGRAEFDGKAICATGPLTSHLPSSGFSPTF